MAVINDQGVRRRRVSAPRTRTVSSRAHLGPAPRSAGAPSDAQRVTRLRARPVPVDVVEQLPLAVGFGSTLDLPPCRLWAVPRPGADGVPLPAVLDDGGQDGRWIDGQRTDDERSASLRRPFDLGSGADAGVRGTDVRSSGTDVRSSGTDVRSSGTDVRGRRPMAVREPASLHLTARGQAVLLLLAAAVGAVVVVFAWFGAGSASVPARAAEPARVTVHDGDTLWSIAGQVAPNHDPRAVVARLLQLNHLRTPTLVPGQVLLTR